MNSKLKVLLSVVAMSFVMVGCGGGSSSSSSSSGSTDSSGDGSSIPPSVPTVLDNSKLSDGENQYGYFGEKVIYGDTIAVGKWTYSGGKDPIDIEILTDGTLLIDTPLGLLPYNYGISADGIVLSHSLGDEKFEIVKTMSNDCYQIDVYTNGQVLDRTLCKRADEISTPSPLPPTDNDDYTDADGNYINVTNTVQVPDLNTSWGILNIDEDMRSFKWKLDGEVLSNTTGMIELYLTEVGVYILTCVIEHTDGSFTYYEYRIRVVNEIEI